MCRCAAVIHGRVAIHVSVARRRGLARRIAHPAVLGDPDRLLPSPFSTIPRDAGRSRRSADPLPRSSIARSSGADRRPPRAPVGMERDRVPGTLLGLLVQPVDVFPAGHRRRRHLDVRIDRLGLRVEGPQDPQVVRGVIPQVPPQSARSPPPIAARTGSAPPPPARRPSCASRAAGMSQLPCSYARHAAGSLATQGGMVTKIAVISSPRRPAAAARGRRGRSRTDPPAPRTPSNPRPAAPRHPQVAVEPEELVEVRIEPPGVARDPE